MSEKPREGFIAVSKDLDEYIESLCVAMDMAISHSVDAVTEGTVNEYDVAGHLYSALELHPVWLYEYPFLTSSALRSLCSAEMADKGASDLIGLVFQQGKSIAAGSDRDRAIYFVQHEARILLDRLIIPAILSPSTDSEWSDYGSDLEDLKLQPYFGDHLSNNLDLMENRNPQPSASAFEWAEHVGVTAAGRRKLCTMVGQTVALNEDSLSRLTEGSRVPFSVFCLNGETRLLIGEHQWEVDGINMTLDVVAEVKCRHTLFKIKSGAKGSLLIQREQAEGDTAEIKKLLREITGKKIRFGPFPYAEFRTMWEQEKSEFAWGELVHFMQTHYRDISKEVEFVAEVRRALDRDGGYDEFAQIHAKYIQPPKSAEQLFQNGPADAQLPIHMGARGRRMIAGSAKRKYAIARDISAKEPIVKEAMTAVHSFPREYWESYIQYLGRVAL